MAEKRMSKLDIYNNVVEQVNVLLEGAKTTKGFQSELLSILEINLAPKSGVGSINPPKLDDEGNIVEAWCRFHERYEVVEAMVISNGKSKGYCRAGISIWNKAMSLVKVHDVLALKAVTDGDFDTAKVEADKSKEIKKNISYDYDSDWKVFNTPKKADIESDAIEAIIPE